jgi:NAD(P)-dependent dehydrogenase (short-subunit alcohol dehydrogenase family)
VVTGAGRGLCRESRLRLASEGAAIMVLDRLANDAQESVALIDGAGGRALAACTGITDRAQAEEAEPKLGLVTTS